MRPFIALFVMALLFLALFYVIKWLRRPNVDSYFSKATGIGLLASFLLLWISLAVGIFGEPDLSEVSALLLLGGLAIVVKLSPKAMVKVMVITAIWQLLVGVWAFANGSLSAQFGGRELLLNAFFALLFVLSAWYYSKVKLG